LPLTDLILGDIIELISISLSFLLDLIQSGGDEASGDVAERRQKRCDNLSDFNKISLQGGHKGNRIFVIFY